MRISDWSSDVCSSDLLRQRTLAAPAAGPARHVAHDQARGPGLRGLVVQWSAAGIAHVRIGQRDDLPRVRRIGEDLLVTGHGGVEHHLRSEEHTSELQSLLRISYAGFCFYNTQHYSSTPTHQ